MSTLAVQPDVLPAWTEDAIALLKPALGIMARPVVVNNLKRVVADPAHPVAAEIELFVEKVEHGIKTFASQAQAESLAGRVRSLILLKQGR